MASADSEAGGPLEQAKLGEDASRAPDARADARLARALELVERGRHARALPKLLQIIAEQPKGSTDPRLVGALTHAETCARQLGDSEALNDLARRWDEIADALGDDAGAEKATLRGRAAAMRSAGGEPELTILTVVLEQHYGYIAQQLALIEALNPSTPFRLVVVDNAGPGEPKLKLDHPRCEVIAGLDQDPSLPEHGRGSYHHAAALNMALGRVTTPWLLVLDPDFFVVYRNWIAEVLDHMRRRKLSLFGAPWHYSWNRKWRYFPCVHFLMIDLGRVGLDELDFTPALVGDAETSSTPFQELLRRHAPFLRNRLLLESRRDTGWRLHRRFGRSHAADVALPVVDTRTEFRGPPHLETSFGRWLEQQLPRRIRFLPAAGTYVESDQAAAFRHPAIKSLAPERFAWRGAPFAVHLRGQMREDMRTSANPAYKERTATRELLDAVAGAANWSEWAFGRSGD